MPSWGSIHMWGDFQEVCSSLEAQSVLAWASLFWGIFLQNMFSHRRPDPENFSWLVFNLQFPLLKGQSHQCRSLECSVPVRGEMGSPQVLVPPGHSYSPEVAPLQSLRGKKDSTAFLNCHKGRKAPFISCFIIQQKKTCQFAGCWQQTALKTD